MLSRKGSILYFSAAIFIVAPVSVSAVGIEVPDTWEYGKKIEITGEQLMGDLPSVRQFCIAPVAKKENKNCLYSNELDEWTYDEITYDPVADLPVNGEVSLQLWIEEERCYGSAGCTGIGSLQEKVIGQYKAKPWIEGVVESGTENVPSEFRRGGEYVIKGAFFGKDGSIFVAPAQKLVPQDIISWKPDEIQFRILKTDLLQSPEWIVVNNWMLSSDRWIPEAVAEEVPSTSSMSEEAQIDVDGDDMLFTDVDFNHAYTQAIQWAKTSGMLSGYPDGSFRPDKSVNRAELLKIVLEATDIDIDSANNEGFTFTDVDKKAWYAPYVLYAKTHDIVQGYADGTFRPDQVVNFAEALKIAYLALDIQANEVGGQWYERYLRHAVGNDVLFSEEARMDEGMSRKDVVWVVWRLKTHVGGWGDALEADFSQGTSESFSQIGDGIHIVGSDVQPGMYRTKKGTSGCYFARLSGFSGEFKDIIANENTDSPAVVAISPTDKGFQSSRCGTWTNDLTAITSSKTSFSDGMFIVGTDIEAGTYKSTGGTSCYYERLRGFSGELDDIIANENTSAPAVVTISATDKGFKSARCGTWSKVN